MKARLLPSAAALLDLALTFYFSTFDAKHNRYRSATIIVHGNTGVFGRTVP